MSALYDEYECAKCGYKGPALDQHHIHGRKNDPDTTIWLCSNCHREEHAPQIRDLRKSRWLWLNAELYRDGWAKEIGPSAVVVYSALALYANNKTQIAFPSHATLKEITGLSKPTVIKCLNILEEFKIVSAQRQAGRVTLYTLNDISEWTSPSGEENLQVKKVNTPVKPVDTGVKPVDTNYTHVTKTKLTQTHAGGEKESRRDYLGDVISFANRMSKNDDRPRGYRDATEEEYRVCERVANLYTGGELPGFADDIEKAIAGANFLLGRWEGNVRGLIRAIDEYHAETDGEGPTITSPYSLRNVLLTHRGQKNERRKVVISQ